MPQKVRLILSGRTGRQAIGLLLISTLQLKGEGKAGSDVNWLSCAARVFSVAGKSGNVDKKLVEHPR